MKSKLNKKIFCLAVAAVVLIAGTSIGKAMAYFTTYVAAEGGAVLALGFSKTEVQETISDGVKYITIANKGTADCYVRVRVIVADESKIRVEEPAGNDNWNKNGEFYYYDSVVKAACNNDTGCDECKTTPLHVVIPEITAKPDANADDFNVIVIQESTPVLYDEDGNTYADWSGEHFDIETK